MKIPTNEDIDLLSTTDLSQKSHLSLTSIPSTETLINHPKPTMSLLKARASNCRKEDVTNPLEKTEHSTKPGDLIIIQERYTNLTAVTLKKDGYLDNRYGRFAHNDLLGKPLGIRWEARSYPGAKSGSQQCAGFVHALAPTPELWSLALEHRTQIVYPHDSAVISLHLDLRPGMTLIECGTGSGSATTAFSRVVAPSGRVRSFEFHEPRAEAARKDLKALGLTNVAEVYGGVDITKDGFIGVTNGEADAVFLDVPAPYLMGKELKRVLKENGTVCLFSPCVEQVQRSCEMLRKEGFHCIKTVTGTIRTYETREQVLELPGFEQLSKDRNDESIIEEHPRKRVRLERTINGNGNENIDEKNKNTKSRTAGAERQAVSALDGRHEGRVRRPKIRLHSKPFSSMKGHTSYLTFARRGRGHEEDEEDSGMMRNEDDKERTECVVN